MKELSGRILCVAVLVTLIPLHLLASPVPPPTAYNTFDGLMPGGRSLSMGYTGAAVTGAPESICFNPAGLGSIKASIVSVTYEALRQSELSREQVFSGDMLKRNNLQFVALVAQGTGFSWRPLSDASLHQTNLTGYSDTEIKINAYTVTASNRTSDTFSSGLNISYLNGRIARAGINEGVPFADISDGNGISVDLGFLYMPVPQLGLGVDLQNLFGMMWWDDFDKEQLPFCLRSGFVFKASGYLTFAYDLEKRFYRKDAETTDILHFGLEQKLVDQLHLRIGTYGSDLNDSDKTHLTAGLGYMDNGYELAISGEKYRVDMKDVYRCVFNLTIPIGQ